MTGRQISHYRIVRTLGVGGMGVVYEAEDLVWPRRVAIKVLSNEAATDADAVRRFRREAAIIAQLNHPNICASYEIGENGDHGGRPFIVMERLEGSDLKRFMLRTSLDTPQIVDIATQIAKALSAAHAHGIVHRDIKPGNVFICRSGEVKVLDFGLARRFRLADVAAPPLDGSTIPGRPLGTANYMAPERIRQGRLEPRSDLFSLGVVIYHMATERLPFAGASPFETLVNVLDRRPVPLTDLSPHRPAALARVVDKLLAKQPDRRYASAATLCGALRRIAEPDWKEGGRSEDRHASQRRADDRAGHQGAVGGWRRAGGDSGAQPAGAPAMGAW
jgi:serine/threonine protein kinase